MFPPATRASTNQPSDRPTIEGFPYFPPGLLQSASANCFWFSYELGFSPHSSHPPSTTAIPTSPLHQHVFDTRERESKLRRRLQDSDEEDRRQGQRERERERARERKGKEERKRKIGIA